MIINKDNNDIVLKQNNYLVTNLLKTILLPQIGNYYFTYILYQPG
ncbi:hypothetical protein ARAF_2575 [Arsenophonus endosymbiont of Aleurodicus floccissimus]|nr:hypothetical protein ARAF_2575 [Arsenophonus endosymbiont of Aleurodicus floccissimus]